MTQDITSKPQTVDASTFAQVMDNATWLMTMSKEHRNLPIKTIDARVSTAILLRCFKLYSKDNKPVAFLTWASVTDEVKARIENGDKELEFKEWTAGKNLIVVDCVSPFNPKEKFEEMFLSSIKQD